MSGADGGIFLPVITAAFSVSGHITEHHAGGIQERDILGKKTMWTFVAA